MVLDAVTTVEHFVDVFIYVYILVILIWVLLSWFRLPYSLNPVQRFLNDVVSPYLNLWRRILPMVGPLDLSPIAGVFGLLVVRYLLDALLNRLH
jgi:YggT family protein